MNVSVVPSIGLSELGTDSPAASGVPRSSEGLPRILVAFEGEALPSDVDALARKWGGTVSFRNEILLPYVAVDLPSPAHVPAALAAAQATPGVRISEQDQRYELDAYERENVAVSTDPLQSRQWGLDAIRAPQAWQALKNHSLVHRPTIVAVIDSGADCTLVDLATACAFPSEDLIGHGTHVAGIVGATRGNAVGIAGVSDAIIYPLKIFDDVLYPFGLDLLAGFKIPAAVLAATAGGARVISMSFGSTGAGLLVHEALRIAYDRGVVLVASGGNNGPGAAMRYPAAFEEVIAVAAVNYTLGVASFSTQNPKIEVAAPGAYILSTYSLGARFWSDILTGAQRTCTGMFGQWQFAPAAAERPGLIADDDTPGIYCYLSGTSMAAPHVSGLAALLLSKCPDLTNLDVRGILSQTAIDLGDPGRDAAYGNGLINAEAALGASDCAGLVPPPI